MQLATTGQTIRNQVKQPAQLPTMCLIFRCFDGISVVQVQQPNGPLQRDIAGLEPLHAQEVRLLGASCATCYTVTG